MAIAPNVSIFYYSCLMFAYDQVTPHDLSDVFFTILLYFMSIVYHPVAYILEMIAKVAPPSQASPFGATSNCIYILLIVNNILVYCTCICQFGNKLLLLLQSCRVLVYMVLFVKQKGCHNNIFIRHSQVLYLCIGLEVNLKRALEITFGRTVC